MGQAARYIRESIDLSLLTVLAGRTKGYNMTGEGRGFASSGLIGLRQSMLKKRWRKTYGASIDTSCFNSIRCGHAIRDVPICICHGTRMPKWRSASIRTVEGRMTSVGFIIGVRWGEGILTLNDGSQYKFTAQGAKLLDTGVAEVTFKGNVYNLEKLEDFEGDYGALAQGLTVIKGITGGAVLSNDNCIYINDRKRGREVECACSRRSVDQV